eukprot:4734129-Pleurochrysis_carterae.AAC.4
MPRNPSLGALVASLNRHDAHAEAADPNAWEHLSTEQVLNLIEHCLGDDVSEQQSVDSAHADQHARACAAQAAASGSDTAAPSGSTGDGMCTISEADDAASGDGTDTLPAAPAALSLTAMEELSRLDTVPLRTGLSGGLETLGLAKDVRDP